MSSSKPLQRFQDIIENIDQIFDFMGEQKPQDALKDIKTEAAVKYSVLCLSEAATKLGMLAEELAPEQPWKSIRMIGNHIRHEYDTLNVSVLCNTIEKRLLPLREDCLQAISTLSRQNEPEIQQQPSVSPSSRP